MDRNSKIMAHFPEDMKWEERYKKIICLGKELPVFNETDKISKFLIPGCQSKLWLKAELNQKNEVVLTGDSEGLITKGLLAIMIQFYSYRKSEDILKSQPEFLKKLDLDQYLTLKRTNGLYALIEQIKNYAKAFQILSSKKA